MFNYYICNEAWRQLFTGHILIFTLCAIIVDLFVVNFMQHCWILSILLVSELTAISNSHLKKKKSLKNKSQFFPWQQVGQMQPNCKIRMSIGCKLMQNYSGPNTGVSQPAAFLPVFTWFLKGGKNWLLRGCPAMTQLSWEGRSRRWFHMQLL